MTAHYTRVATANLPESVSPRKPGLHSPPRRAEAALALMETSHIGLLAAQEAGTHLIAACREHDWFNYVRATPNQNRNGKERGNVIVFDRREWHVSFDEKHDRPDVRDLRIMIPDGPFRRPSKTHKRPIYQQRVRFTHIPTGRQVRVWNVHKPVDIRAYQEARGELNGHLHAAAEHWDDHDLLAILLGDFNGAPPPLVGMKRRASVGPDNIVATEYLEHRGKQYHSLRKISDHHNAVSIELAIPERRLRAA